jgi:hypothetical protein
MRRYLHYKNPKKITQKNQFLITPRYRLRILNQKLR